MPAELTEAQRDALREFANVGAGHAAATLSRLLGGERLAFEPPEARTATASELAQLLGGEAVARVAAMQEVRGDVTGALWLVLGPPDAQRLAERLLRTPHPPERAVDGALVQAALEMGAFALTAMGRLTGLGLEGSAPTLCRTAAGALACGWCAESSGLLLHAHLRAEHFTAQLLFLPHFEALGTLLRSLRV